MFNVTNATTQELFIVFNVSIIEENGPYTQEMKIKVVGERETYSNIELSLLKYQHTDDILVSFPGFLGDLLASMGYKNTYQTYYFIQNTLQPS